MTGVVKTVNMEKGFGFIGCDGFEKDVYFKVDSPIEVGTSVSFALAMTQDGKPQAQLGSVSQMPSENEEMLGTIKSFNSQKGYGFVEVPGQSGDVYFKPQELPPHMAGLPGESLVGQQVSFRVRVTPDGKMQMRGANSNHAAPQGAYQVVRQPPPPGVGVKRAAPSAQAWPEPQKRPRMPAAPPAIGSADTAYGCSVKSYNAVKGWGFLDCPELGGDVYFQRKLLPPHLQDVQLVGYFGSVQVQYTPDGKPQALALQLDG